MFVNTMPRYEILSEEAMAVLDRGWRRIVTEIGIEFLLDEAVEQFRAAGQQVDGQKVILDPDFVLEQVAKVPREFDLQARNPDHSVHIGGQHMAFASVYGCPFVREGDLRREATMADFENLVRLSQAFLPAHVAELVRAAWELGDRPELDRLRLRAWAHMLGFRGHWSTKSRRYSTTMTLLRRARVAFAKRRRAKDGVPLDAWGRPEDDDQAVIVVASWAYVGSGYATEGERWLALSAAARAREHRRIAREELTTTTRSAA